MATQQSVTSSPSPDGDSTDNDGARTSSLTLPGDKDFRAPSIPLQGYNPTKESGRKGTNLAARQFSGMVRNIVNVHNDLEASHPHLVASGDRWYEEAHDIASKVGRGDVHKGAGILAALSPQKGWDPNVRMAHELAKTGTTTGQTNDQLVKAQRILAGEHPTDVLGGHKETSFFHNIADPNDPHHVTVDRHAHDIAVGQKVGSGNRGLGAIGRYNHFHEAYNTAAGHLGIAVPSRLQARVWVGQEQGLTRFS